MSRARLLSVVRLFLWPSAAGLVAFGLWQPCLAADPPLSLGLSIRCPLPELHVGDEIPVEFIITNRGTNEYSYRDRNYDRSGRMEEFRLLAKTETGQTVPDPRAHYVGGFGGGLSGLGKLKPGHSFTNTIALNRWALIRAPGRYQITGIYVAEDGHQQSTSAPLAVIVQPRSEAEMLAYVRQLDAQRKSTATQSQDEIVRKLMYTCHPSIIPILLETYYGPRSGFWEAEAFLYYLPRNAQTKQAIMNAARKRGLASGMSYVLAEYGCTAKEMAPLIERSLAPENPHAWASGALAAQQYADDALTPRLIAIATDPKSEARLQAIYALALNRTDESVQTLKMLLHDAEESVRRTATNAIRTAYLYRGNSQGRPLADTDFKENLRQRE
jgi:hypothetical protein